MLQQILPGQYQTTLMLNIMIATRIIAILISHFGNWFERVQRHLFFSHRKRVTVGDKHFIFVDGGITSYNNPAFQMFLMATAEPYGLNWQTGEDKMLIVSVGTGANPMANDNLLKDEMNLFYNATKLPSALMNAAAQEQDFLCRAFGKCLSGEMIDREIGDMCVANEDSKCGGPADPKLFTYVRYNAELTKDGLNNLAENDDVRRALQN